MNSLFNQSDVNAVLGRIDLLTPDTQKEWGKMNAAQMLAHCNASVETAMGKNNIKRIFIGRLISPFIKTTVLSEKPFGRNSPTDKSYKFPPDVNFTEQKSKLKQSIRQFFEGGAIKCTSYPHPFFGHFAPDQWAVFQWKHLDHHLRQFGV